MLVTVRKAEIKKGNDKNGNAYLFTNAFVVFDDKITAANVTIDNSICHPDKIKPGVRAELFVSQTNRSRATIFDIVGAKDETSGVKASEDPFESYDEVSADDFDIDASTGEAKEKNKK